MAKLWTVQFSAPIEIINGNPYVLVSAERAEQLHKDWKKPMPVIIQVNGQPKPAWRINMMPIGDGTFYLYLHGDVREASQTKVGDTVKVSINFDHDYQNGPIHPMPDWFGQALNKNAKAQTAWDALPPSRQKEVLRYFSWLKSEAAVQRNLAKVMSVLSGQPGRFMARDWQDGK